MQSDRRQYTRLGLTLKTRYRILESLGEHDLTITKDVSEKGVCIPLTEKLERGTFLELALTVPREPKPIHAIGRVVWTRRMKNARLHITGILLVHIKQVDRERIHKFALR